jgi:hypothetical protein
MKEKYISKLKSIFNHKNKASSLNQTRMVVRSVPYLFYVNEDLNSAIETEILI